MQPLLNYATYIFAFDNIHSYGYIDIDAKCDIKAKFLFQLGHCIDLLLYS